MSSDRALNIFIEEDGDVCIFLTKNKIPIDEASIEFCETGSGGGRSPKTRQALFKLIEAIQEDNLDNPIRC